LLVVLAIGRLGVSTLFNRGNAKFLTSSDSHVISFNNDSGILLTGFLAYSNNDFLDQNDNLSTNLHIFHNTTGLVHSLPICLHNIAHTKNFHSHSGVVGIH
jgi:hypothetical protein